jgi:hypothetical protein
VFTSRNRRTLEPSNTVYKVKRHKQDSNKERDVLRDLPRDEPNTRFIPANLYRHHVYMDNGIYKRRSTKYLIHSHPVR